MLSLLSTLCFVQSSGELYNENGQCQSIYRILKVSMNTLCLGSCALTGLMTLLCFFLSLQDTAKCLAGEPMKRITMSYSHFSYVVTLDEHNIYIAKVKSE